MATADVDPQETQEWLEALDAVVEHDGRERAQELLDAVVHEARRSGVAACARLDDAVRQHDPEGPRGAARRATRSSSTSSGR